MNSKVDTGTVKEYSPKMEQSVLRGTTGRGNTEWSRVWIRGFHRRCQGSVPAGELRSCKPATQCDKKKQTKAAATTNTRRNVRKKEEECGQRAEVFD